MRWIYTQLVRLALPLLALQAFWRGFAERDYWRGWSARLGLGACVEGGVQLWVHAASVGEVQAATALVRAWQAQHMGAVVALTCSTPAGMQRARQALGADALLRYAPYDLPGAVRRALARLRPRLLVVVETELWPNLFHGCLRAGVPVLLASARVSVRTAARLGRLPALLQAPLARNTWVAAQTQADAARLQALGVPAARVQVTGNIKFDLQVEPQVRTRGQQLRLEYAAARPLWVAGSTHPGEEAQALAAHRQVRARHPLALLVLAPRHRSRFEAVAAVLRDSGLASTRRTAPAATDAMAAVLLLDTIGELMDFYAAADVAFVGGSLVPVGGHNLLEPAVLGVPVVSGPAQFNSPDAARLLAAAGALTSVPDAAALAQTVIALLDDPARARRQSAAAAATVAANRGALAQVLALVAARLYGAPGDGAAGAPVSGADG